ncbi:hypothetical protein BHM03_00022914 [Ensete ventricosum]|nr:hypothetical protein BHM03_00022914 [Ensete ventricosum]
MKGVDVVQLAEMKLRSEGLSTEQEDIEVGVTREWVGKGELPKGANTIRGGGGPMMCWQRPHIERLGMIRALGELDCSSAYSLKGTRQVRGQGRAKLLASESSMVVERQRTQGVQTLRVLQKCEQRASKMLVTSSIHEVQPQGDE